ncbi:MAG: thioesterase family protein [Ruminococcus sp.]|nr:thioesterase family protein [Ruminococcus sp.]
MDLEIGAEATASLTVSPDELAVNVGSGSLEVFATPIMVMLMEKAACNCIAPFLEGDETTVGTEMNVQHTAATPEGMTVSAKAVLKEINGRELVFDVSASDSKGAIGNGTHKRFVVYGERFTEKAKAKLN